MILGGDEHRCSCSNCDSHCNSNSDGPGPKNNNFSWKESEDSSIGDLVTDSLSHFWFWTIGNLIFMTIVTTKNLTGDHLQFLRCLQAFYGNHYLHLNTLQAHSDVSGQWFEHADLPIFQAMLENKGNGEVSSMSGPVSFFNLITTQTQIIWRCKTPSTKTRKNAVLKSYYLPCHVL